jgi:hypothetical protein
MNAQYLQFDLPTEGLKGVIEPLVSYICAAERPRTALLSALKTLCREVEQTNRTALAHVGTLAGTR